MSIKDKIADLICLNEKEKQEFERVYSNIVVPDQISRFHPLVQKSNIDISKNSLDRARRVLDTLIRALEELGYPVTKDKKKNYFFVKIHKNEIGFKLKEHHQQINHIATPEEIARQKRDSYYNIPPYEYLPTGELALIIDDYLVDRKTWNDGKKKIEECLGDFIIGLARTIEAIHIRDERLRIEEEQRLEAEKQRRKREKILRNEQERFKKLEEAAMNWHKAQIIRSFIAEVETNLEESNESRKIVEWVKWAKEKAEWLDPLVAKNDSILGVRSSQLLVEENDDEEDDD
jgi:hypothetical protein